ncbi:MAG: hypothetical protein F6K54_20880 [Okeania sp. SIO3B5]|uniref:hypothetical protein n=1 Tax=Okeania sp. SIO3B5 TaxID=2607811 RepID=UPI0013FE74A5|nr:hypothetical protein [Okeania sp. SIO3B5]NEO55308.1 hypothetical protein [Okeania sp. SIO3B5]
MARHPIHGVRKERINLTITPESRRRLKQIAEALNTSQGELLEKWIKAWDKLESVELLGEYLACSGK